MKSSTQVELDGKLKAVADRARLPPNVREQLYTTLRAWQIRRLRIQPLADLKSPLVCELLVAGLVVYPGAGLVDEFKIVEYEALSYSWGHPVSTYLITCNGVAFPVGEALHDALRHLRYTDKVRYLWCDACCIDQANPIEKGEQVQSMFTIFQKARRVVAWLGLPSTELAYLLTAITRGQVMGGTRLRDAAWQLISTVPYFRRCWIRQEIEAARDVVVVSGSHVIPLATFTGEIGKLLIGDDKKSAIYRPYRTSRSKHAKFATRIADEPFLIELLRNRHDFLRGHP